MAAVSERAVGLLRRVSTALQRPLDNPRTRRWVLVLAFVLFAAVSITSFLALPARAQFDWRYVPLFVVLTTPLTVAANAAEFRIMGAINGHAIGWAPAARLTLVAAAANLLPLPGGVAVRTEALHRRGTSYRRALGANAAAGLAWVGMGSLVIGVLLAIAGDAGWAIAALVAAGVICVVLTHLLLRRLSPGREAGLLWQLLVVESVTVAVNGARIYFAFRLIGLSADAAQSIALTSAHIVAAAIGIFPAGIGLRELLAGGIGSAVGLSVASSVAATAADRVVSQLGLALLCVPLLVRRRARVASEPDVAPMDLP